MAAVKVPKLEESDILYEQYGKPLEAQHRGEYLAVSPQGDTLIGPDLDELIDKAVEKLGSGNFIFKIGDVAVGKWRPRCAAPPLYRLAMERGPGGEARRVPALYRSRMIASISGSSIVKSRSS